MDERMNYNLEDEHRQARHGLYKTFHVDNYQKFHEKTDDSSEIIAEYLEEIEDKIDRNSKYLKETKNEMKEIEDEISELKEKLDPFKPKKADLIAKPSIEEIVLNKYVTMKPFNPNKQGDFRFWLK